ncbi:hypothetical protein C8F04DRAFT_1180866 [Mycena alexandri]|uniref:Uncharacterized protein n=1 Tax=Mycena alexandri TaxID=1745969 RepID=A0AAD6T1N6_9AGAR|nr:hypothetical protein C8F04DRAFT_1180866 [Mycena alexandri]
MFVLIILHSSGTQSRVEFDDALAFAEQSHTPPTSMISITFNFLQVRYGPQIGSLISWILGSLTSTTASWGADKKFWLVVWVPSSGGPSYDRLSSVSYSRLVVLCFDGPRFVLTYESLTSMHLWLLDLSFNLPHLNAESMPVGLEVHGISSYRHIHTQIGLDLGHLWDRFNFNLPCNVIAPRSDLSSHIQFNPTQLRFFHESKKTSKSNSAAAFKLHRMVNGKNSSDAVPPLITSVRFVHLSLEAVGTRFGIIRALGRLEALKSVGHKRLRILKDVPLGPTLRNHGGRESRIRWG